MDRGGDREFAGYSGRKGLETVGYDGEEGCQAGAVGGEEHGLDVPGGEAVVGYAY